MGNHLKNSETPSVKPHTGGGNKRGTKRSHGSIRKLPSGRFQLRYTDPDGLPQNGGTYATEAKANSALVKIAGAIDNGTYNRLKADADGELNPKTVTLSELAEHWRSIRVNKRGEPLAPKTSHEYARLVQSTLAPFKDKTIRSITSSQVEKWWATEYRRAPRQTNSAYKHLKTLFEWAVKRKLVSSNPCDIEGATSYTSKLPPAPSAKQVEIMLDVAPEEYKALIALAGWGGLRKGELLALTRSDVEVIKDGADKDIYVHVSKSVTWENKTPIVKSTKNTRARTVVMPPLVHEIITRHLTTVAIAPDALLFPRRGGNNEHWGEYQLQPIWEQIRVQAGYEGRFHSLRTFAASEYSKTGANDIELMARFGHSDIKTAMRYQRTTGRERDLARKLG